MEAKDTVMNEMLIKIWVLEFIQPGELDLNAKLKEFALAQAEISFKAGIREVIEWGNEPCPHFYGEDEGSRLLKRECYKCWQAQKEEWYKGGE